jgi:hypothetical protein
MWIMSKRKVIELEDFIGFVPVKDKMGPGIRAAIIKASSKHIWILVISGDKFTMGRMQ